jgi:hypothetical protein
VFFGAFRGRGFPATTTAAARPAAFVAPVQASKRTRAAATTKADLEEAAEPDALVADTDGEQEELEVSEPAHKAQPSPSPAPSASVPQM